MSTIEDKALNYLQQLEHYILKSDTVQQNHHIYEILSEVPSQRAALAILSHMQSLTPELFKNKHLKNFLLFRYGSDVKKSLYPDISDNEIVEHRLLQTITFIESIPDYKGKGVIWFYTESLNKQLSSIKKFNINIDNDLKIEIITRLMAIDHGLLPVLMRHDFINIDKNNVDLFFKMLDSESLYYKFGFNDSTFSKIKPRVYDNHLLLNILNSKNRDCIQLLNQYATKKNSPAQLKSILTYENLYTLMKTGSITKNDSSNKKVNELLMIFFSDKNHDIKIKMINDIGFINDYFKSDMSSSEIDETALRFLADNYLSSKIKDISPESFSYLLKTVNTPNSDFDAKKYMCLLDSYISTYGDMIFEPLVKDVFSEFCYQSRFNDFKLEPNKSVYLGYLVGHHLNKFNQRCKTRSDVIRQCALNNIFKVKYKHLFEMRDEKTGLSISDFSRVIIDQLKENGDPIKHIEKMYLKQLERTLNPNNGKNKKDDEVTFENIL